MNQAAEEKLFDLLERRAIEGMTDAEERELRALQAADDDTFDLTAASISLSEIGDVEPLPPNVRARIELAADRYFAERMTEVRDPVVSQPVSGFWSWFGWALAAAACVALAANIYLTKIDSSPDLGGTPGPSPVPIQSSPEEMRARLIASAADIARAEIGPGKEAYKPSGDIVWSDARQEGYIHIIGLPKNDALQQQYQLWIFDKDQDPKTPIDGGVFDIRADGEIVIPIDAKIKINGPKAFAITVEKPGGVVVSKQEKVAALAKVET